MKYSFINGDTSLVTNKIGLTKNTYVVRQRKFRMVDLEKRLWMRDQSVFFTSHHPPYMIACLEIRMPGCYNLAYAKSSHNLDGSYTPRVRQQNFRS